MIHYLHREGLGVHRVPVKHVEPKNGRSVSKTSIQTKHYDARITYLLIGMASMTFLMVSVVR